MKRRKSSQPFDILKGVPRRYLIGGGAFILFILLGMIGNLMTPPKKQGPNADSLYAKGKKSEAVQQYKEDFKSFTKSRKTEVINRIIEHEAEQGNQKELDAWIKRAVDEDLPLDSKRPLVQELASKFIRQRGLGQAGASNAGGSIPFAREDKPQVIPGLQPTDVYLNFTNKGFSLTKNLQREQCAWFCTEETLGHSSTVTVYGNGPTDVTLCRGMYVKNGTNGLDREAAEFLGYLASITYDGSQPADARAWVVNNIGKNATMTIGGVSFELIASPSAPNSRVLQITPAP